MSGENTKIVREQGGDELSVKDGGEIDVEAGGTLNVDGAFVVGGDDVTDELEVLADTTADAAELNRLAGVTPGTAAASKALVLGATKNVDTLDVLVPKSDGITLSNLKWVDVTVTAALLDSAGTVNVVAGVAGDQYKVRNIRLVGGGTNFGAGGDRDISLTDGTTVWTTVANADIESAPAATLDWGDAKVPFLTGTSDTASVAGQAIRFAYSGGTTDHGGTGSIKFSVCLEKVA